MKKIMMILMAAAAALTSCEKEEMPEEPIVWHETCAIHLLTGKVCDPEHSPNADPNAEPPYMKPSVDFVLSISGEQRSKITGGKSLYRIVNYGKEKILFSDCGASIVPEFWEEGKMESCGWFDGLCGETPATPDASYAAGFFLPAKVGTYLFEIQLHKPAHYKNQHHFRTPVYQMTITHEGTEWGLDLKEVPRPTVQP
ncbi:MAG: hypothetical protein RR996_04630 [Alistipes sp.]